MLMKPCRTPYRGSWMRCDYRDGCAGFIPVDVEEAPVEEVFEDAYACKYFSKKSNRPVDYIRPEISKERCACSDKGHLDRAVIKVTSCYCPKEEQDIFHDDLNEHCRFCGQCQRGKPVHEITNRHDYLMQYGCGLKLNPKQII